MGVFFCFFLLQIGAHHFFFFFVCLCLWVFFFQSGAHHSFFFFVCLCLWVFFFSKWSSSLLLLCMYVFVLWVWPTFLFFGWERERERERERGEREEIVGQKSTICGCVFYAARSPSKYNNNLTKALCLRRGCTIAAAAAFATKRVVSLFCLSLILSFGFF